MAGFGFLGKVGELRGPDRVVEVVWCGNDGHSSYVLKTIELRHRGWGRN